MPAIDAKPIIWMLQKSEFIIALNASLMFVIIAVQTTKTRKVK